MIAFYSNGKATVKAYNHGDAWQIFDDTSELWFRVLQDNKRASLLMAFVSFLGKDVNPNSIHGLKDIRG